MDGSVSEGRGQMSEDRVRARAWLAAQMAVLDEARERIGNLLRERDPVRFDAGLRQVSARLEPMARDLRRMAGVEADEAPPKVQRGRTRKVHDAG